MLENNSISVLGGFDQAAPRQKERRERKSTNTCPNLPPKVAILHKKRLEKSQLAQMDSEATNDTIVLSGGLSISVSNSADDSLNLRYLQDNREFSSVVCRPHPDGGYSAEYRLVGFPEQDHTTRFYTDGSMTSDWQDGRHLEYRQLCDGWAEITMTGNNRRSNYSAAATPLTMEVRYADGTGFSTEICGRKLFKPRAGVKGILDLLASFGNNRHRHTIGDIMSAQNEFHYPLTRFLGSR